MSSIILANLCLNDTGLSAGNRSIEVERIATGVILLFLFFLGFHNAASATEGVSPASNSAEERVTFYPTYGYRQDGEWILPFRIWVHEKPDLLRRKLAQTARTYIAGKAGISNPSNAEIERFENRAEGFVADSESLERVVFEFDNDPEHQQFYITNNDGYSRTDRNGSLEGTIRLDEATAARLLEAQQSNSRWLRFHAISDNHYGIGYVRLIPPNGLSVISDIDDTIKMTGILEGEGVVLRNTFFREFAAAPCMAQMYRRFGENTAFHYVSGGPWQMYHPLADFMFSKRTGFPLGSVHMKNVRTNPFEIGSYQDIWPLIANGSQQTTFDQKVAQISLLLAHFPDREFILIGDSGEKDPEVFNQIREKFPSRIRQIIIRQVTTDSVDNPARFTGMTLVPQDVPAPQSCDDVISTTVPQTFE